jgi:polyhydroxybutyrate depolymerase
MWRFWLFLMLLATQAQAAGTEVALGERAYVIDLPAQPAGAPILLALHGGGGNPAQFARNSGLGAPAKAQGYAVIYPAGTGRSRLLTWNGGYCCGYAAREGIDDLAFLQLVIEDSARRFGLDARRVYLTGMSNGAILAEAFAATHPEVKAVAGVSGTLDLSRYPPKASVPLLHIHGTADSQVPYNGGKGETGLTSTRFTPVESVIAAFRAPFGPMIASQALIDPADDGMRSRENTWSINGVPMVRLLSVEGGGHVWPGGRRSVRQKGATQDIDATAEILRFFAAHP